MGEDTSLTSNISMPIQKGYTGPERRKQNERLCGELEQLLHRCITGLAILAEASGSIMIKAQADSLHRAVQNSAGNIDLPDIRISLQQLADEIASSVKAGKFQTQAPEQKIPELNEALISLVEKLDLPVEMNEATDLLKQRLQRGFNADEMPEVVELTGLLIAQMRVHVRQERLGIEDFLSNLTERLSEIDLSLQSEEAARAGLVRRVQELDAAIELQAQGTSKAVPTGADLAELKLVIEECVEAIGARVKEFHLSGQPHTERVERNHDNQAQQQIRVLTSRLQNLEVETGKLRERVAREHSQALHDSLTGLSNRRAYKERLMLEYARWQRYGSPLILLIWDIDRFKGINDTYGHKAGDKALVTIAHLLRDQIRATDFLARYGGEEFVILMPETSQQAAATVAETLRTNVATCNFHFRGSLVPITISCGGAQINQTDSPEKLFERADAALYEAKKMGGNQCIFASGPTLN